jgi:hypothetical protein
MRIMLRNHNIILNNFCCETKDRKDRMCRMDDAFFITRTAKRSPPRLYSCIRLCWCRCMDVQQHSLLQPVSYALIDTVYEYTLIQRMKIILENMMENPN